MAASYQLDEIHEYDKHQRAKADPEIYMIDDSGDENNPCDLTGNPNLQDSADKKRVTKPVLQKLDVQFLAPLKSPLFKRFFKKGTNAHGTREKKKSRDG